MMESESVSVVFPAGRQRADLECKDKSLTQQHLAADTDINAIIRKFEKTGLVTHVTEKVARYGDFTNIPDYQTSLNLVRAAEQQFMLLPADMRERFDNDPSKMVEFLSDSKNRDEAVALGMLAVADVEAKGTEANESVKPSVSGDKASS